MIASYTDVMLNLLHRLDTVKGLEDEVRILNDDVEGLNEQIDFLNKEIRDILRLSVSRPMMMGQVQTTIAQQKTQTSSYQVDEAKERKKLAGIAGELQEYCQEGEKLLPSMVKKQVTLKIEAEKQTKQEENKKAALPPPPPGWIKDENSKNDEL